jgi:hypothetical protein
MLSSILDKGGRKLGRFSFASAALMFEAQF